MKTAAIGRRHREQEKQLIDFAMASYTRQSSKPELNSQTAAGRGTGFTKKLPAPTIF